MSNRSQQIARDNLDEFREQMMLDMSILQNSLEMLFANYKSNKRDAIIEQFYIQNILTFLPILLKDSAHFRALYLVSQNAGSWRSAIKTTVKDIFRPDRIEITPLYKHILLQITSIKSDLQKDNFNIYSKVLDIINLTKDMIKKMQNKLSLPSPIISSQPVRISSISSTRPSARASTRDSARSPKASTRDSARASTRPSAKSNRSVNGGKKKH